MLLAGENKRKILMKEGGAYPGLAFVNRDREACGRPWFSLFLLQERGMAPLLFVKGRLYVQAAQVFGFKGRGASRFNRERGKNGGFGLFPFFLKGEKTSPAERRENQKIKKPLPPEGFLWFFIKGGGGGFFQRLMAFLAGSSLVCLWPGKGGRTALV